MKTNTQKLQAIALAISLSFGGASIAYAASGNNDSPMKNQQMNSESCMQNAMHHGIVCSSHQ